jgi:tetratricopeptide (TPR) repeat protein
MEDHRLSKVEILIQQKKYIEAEKILKDLLSQDASNALILSLLAEVNLQQNKHDVATSIIDNAIGLSPEMPYLFYLKARIAIQKDDYQMAEDSIHEAIALDAYDADYFAFLASIKLSRKQFQVALSIANEALTIDSENLLALNVRSSALLKLDQSEASFSTIEGALREDPNNAFTHANYGWGLLESGNHQKALEHFKESLKNEPSYEYAQAGMLEAIKAANPLYKIFLKYSFWMGNLTAKYQWAVIIGFYVGFNLLKSLANNNETLRPYLTPLIIALAFIAFSTWVINPVSNLFLRFNAYGKLLLDKNEKMSSNFVAVSFSMLLIGALLYFILSDERYLSVAIFGFAMMLPFGVMFSPTKQKNTLLFYTLGMAVIGILAIVQTFLTGNILNNLATVFLVGFVGFQWVANFLMIKENN